MIFLQSDQLSVATLLSGSLHDRIYRAVVPPGEVIVARSGRELTDRAATAWNDAAVVEPHLVDLSSVPHREWPDVVPLVAYVRLCQADALDAIQLARRSPVELVIYGHGDDPASLRGQLLRVRGSSNGRALLHALAPYLESLPSRVREGIAILCQTASPRDTVAALAVQCCTSEATLSRCLKQAGIPRPQHLVVAARIVRAYQLLLREELPAIGIAHALGVASVESLNRQLYATVRTDLDGARAISSLDEFIARAVRSIVTPPTPARTRAVP